MANEREASRARAGEPTVGAVVVNHNGGERVLRVLDALRRQCHPLAAVIVVDNASDDGSREIIRETCPFARVIGLEGNMGISIARNVGLRALDTSLALLLDHDVYVEDDCIEKMVRAHTAHGATVVCPRIRLIPERDVVQADGAALHFLGTQILRNGYQCIERAPAVAGPVDSCIGACMLLDRERVLRSGGFDELFFFYFEDLEFSMRMRASGYRIWCEPEALVFHERANGTPKLSFRGNGPYPPSRAYHTMRNRLLSMLIHYRLRTLLLLSPVLVLHEIASFAIACRRGWARQWLRAWYWQFANVPTIAARRRRMHRLRSVADRELLVGGPPPLAPAFLHSPMEKRLHSWFAKAVNGYWNLARDWIG